MMASEKKLSVHHEKLYRTDSDPVFDEIPGIRKPDMAAGIRDF